MDYRGNTTIDPTKNVLDLVRAAIANQDAMRDGLKELMVEKVGGLKEILNIISDAQTTFQNAQLEAETRRINELASTRQEFSNTIRDMLAESVRTTSNLVSTQLVQIQATFDTRVTKLEAGAFTQAGKSSVQDPQTAAALASMASGISSLSSTTTDAMTRLTHAIANMQSTESGVSGQRKGMSDTNARLLAIVMAVAAVSSPIVVVLAMLLRGH